MGTLIHVKLRKLSYRYRSAAVLMCLDYLVQLHNTMKRWFGTSEMLKFEKDSDAGSSVESFMNLMHSIVFIGLMCPLVAKEFFFDREIILPVRISVQYIMAGSYT